MIKNIFPRQSSNNYYLYMVDFSGNTYWFISNRAGDSTYNIAGFAANVACPDGKNAYIIKNDDKVFTFFVYF